MSTIKPEARINSTAIAEGNAKAIAYARRIVAELFDGSESKFLEFFPLKVGGEVHRAIFPAPAPLTWSELAVETYPASIAPDAASKAERDALRLYLSMKKAAAAVEPSLACLGNVPIRFFADFADEPETVEMTRAEFEWHLAQHYGFRYERHTIRENGVSQICLTLNEGGI